MRGFRGYVTSRPFLGQRVPQHVQNIVIRDYCKGRNMPFLLSGTEYAFPDSRLMLTQLLDQLDQLDGIVFYSLFQLPNKKALRESIYEQVLSKRKSMHFAVETLVFSEATDQFRLEETWGVSLEVQHALASDGAIPHHG